MGKGKKDSGYQYLENAFWELIATRKIYGIPQLLYIYLRGKYCKYGPEFYCSDAELIESMGVCRNTFRKARRYLQERGLVLLKKGGGKTWTYYTMLDSVLLPNIRRVRGSKYDPQGVKIRPSGGQNMTLSMPVSRRSGQPIVINKVKNKVSVSHKKKKFKRYSPYNRESFKYKNKLNKILGR